MLDGFSVECANQFCRSHVFRLPKGAAYTGGNWSNSEAHNTQAWITRTKMTSKACAVLHFKVDQTWRCKVPFSQTTHLHVDEPPRKHPVQADVILQHLRIQYTRSASKCFPPHLQSHPWSLSVEHLVFKKKRWGDSTVEVEIRCKQDKWTPLHLSVWTSTVMLHKTRSSCNKKTYESYKVW